MGLIPGKGVGGGKTATGSGAAGAAGMGVNGGVGGGGSNAMSNECLVFVNTLEACSKFAGRLRESLERDASAAFGRTGHDAERVMSCLQGLGSTGALFARAASDCLEEVRWEARAQRKGRCDWRWHPCRACAASAVA